MWKLPVLTGTHWQDMIYSGQTLELKRTQSFVCLWQFKKAQTFSHRVKEWMPLLPFRLAFKVLYIVLVSNLQLSVKHYTAKIVNKCLQMELNRYFASVRQIVAWNCDLIYKTFSRIKERRNKTRDLFDAVFYLEIKKQRFFYHRTSPHHREIEMHLGPTIS